MSHSNDYSNSNEPNISINIKQEILDEQQLITSDIDNNGNIDDDLGDLNDTDFDDENKLNQDTSWIQGF